MKSNKKLGIIALLILISITYIVAMMQPRPVLQSNQGIFIYQARYKDRRLDVTKLDCQKIAEVMRTYDCRYEFKRAGIYLEGDYPIEVHIHICDAQTGERIPYLLDLLIGKDATVSDGRDRKMYTILNAD